MAERRIIFLDVDGVLNSALVYGNLGPGLERIDPDAVQRVNVITDATGAKVVISSSWRVLHPFADLLMALSKKGMTAPVVGVTPDLSSTEGELVYRGRPRGDEIKAWLDAVSPPVTSFVILDDDDDMEPHMDHLVQTSFDDGLQDEHVERAIKMLGHECNYVKKGPGLQVCSVPGCSKAAYGG